MCTCVGHARKEACVLSNPMPSTSAPKNYLPAGALDDWSSSSSSSDSDEDDRDAFSHDPMLVEDKELGFHVS